MKCPCFLAAGQIAFLALWVDELDVDQLIIFIGQRDNQGALGEVVPSFSDQGLIGICQPVWQVLEGKIGTTALDAIPHD
ncbi:hypothetical protein D3C71_1745420 [compost metagenome]